MLNITSTRTTTRNRPTPFPKRPGNSREHRARPTRPEPVEETTTVSTALPKTTEGSDQ